MSLVLRFRNFAQQWRHWYLLLLAIFLLVSLSSARAVQTLKNMRDMTGFHPIHVLMLMYMLRMIWLFTLVVGVVYGLSFAIRPLKTAEAILGIALWSSAILALGLIIALNAIIWSFR